MATMNQVIEYVDRVKLNTYSDNDKYKWMQALEGMIIREVLGGDDTGYSIPDDADTELLVPAPYDEMYSFYVMAMIDLHNKEYDHYNNMTLVFQERLDQFKKWFIRQNRMPGAANFRNVMG